MLDHEREPGIPTVAALRQTDLSRITGHPGTRLLRLRYQPDTRAILHVALCSAPGSPEGSIWFYAGNKAERLAARLPHARFDVATGALFQAFPQDHRLPSVAAFLAASDVHAVRLIGGPARSAPVLVRYRPGLSATFRWTRFDGATFFVKHATDIEVTAHAQCLRNLQDAARGRGLGFSTVAGVVPELGLIAYSAAPGLALSEALSDADLTQVLCAMRTLWSLPVVPAKMLDRAALLAKASRAQRMIAFLDEDAGRLAADLLAKMEEWRVAVHMRPIHADMKLEHAVLDGRQTSLIDMDSLALGDPDYDLASLDARITWAGLRGQISQTTAKGATHLVRQLAGPSYLWFLACARLACAAFIATRLETESIPLLRRILEHP